MTSTPIDEGGDCIFVIEEKVDDFEIGVNEINGTVDHASLDKRVYISKHISLSATIPDALVIVAESNSADNFIFLNL